MVAYHRTEGRGYSSGGLGSVDALGRRRKSATQLTLIADNPDILSAEAGVPGVSPLRRAVPEEDYGIDQRLRAGGASGEPPWPPARSGVSKSVSKDDGLVAAKMTGLKSRLMQAMQSRLFSAHQGACSASSRFAQEKPHACPHRRRRRWRWW